MRFSAKSRVSCHAKRCQVPHRLVLGYGYLAGLYVMDIIAQVLVQGKGNGSINFVVLHIAILV